MSESSKKIIKFFCDRFLDLDYYPTNLKAVMELSVDKFKGIKQKSVEKLKKIEIQKLRDFLNYKSTDFKKLLKKSQLDQSILQNGLIAANLIANAWNKRNLYLKKPKMKVVTAGLDFAGKTSLINRLISNQSFNEITNLEPTIGANVEEFQTDRLSLIVWDLGGQKNHIDEYLSEPERFFIQVDVLIFVFDTQDDRRYDNAAKYLSDLINILEFLNEFPFLLILMNKVDSDIVDNPDFQIKLEYLTDKITNIFLNREKSWTFEIIPTSIYNYYSNEPEIAKNIKNIFSKDIKPKKNEEYLSIEDKLQTILDINLNLLDRITTELAEIKRIISRLAPSDISQSLFSIPFERVPQEYTTMTRKKKGNKKDETRKKRKKSDKVVGPPKKLESLPVPKKSKTSDSELIQKAKDSPPSIKAPESLKPPPPPPSKQLTMRPQVRRLEIISELKELFIKRGIVK